MESAKAQLDPDVLARASEGDAEAFEQMHALMRPVVRDYLFYAGRSFSEDQRSDLEQEVFARIWTQRGAYKGRAAPMTYVLAIAHHVLCEHARKQKRKPLELDDFNPQLAVEEDPLAGLRQQEVLARLEQAKRTLPPAQLEAIELDLMCGLSRAQAIELAGCTAEQFTDRLYRAKQKLKWMLRDFMKP